MAMNRIKVINEPSELVPMLRSVDTPVKRDVLKEVTLEWRTAEEIEKKFGPEGKDAIIFFEKMKLVESRWLSLVILSMRMWRSSSSSSSTSLSIMLSDTILTASK